MDSSIFTDVGALASKRFGWIYVALLIQLNYAHGKGHNQHNHLQFDTLQNNYAQQLRIFMKSRHLQMKRPPTLSVTYRVRHRAAELDISDQVTNMHNRWRKTEFLKGSRSTRNMRDYYTELKLTQKIRLEYTMNL